MAVPQRGVPGRINPGSYAPQDINRWDRYGQGQPLVQPGSPQAPPNSPLPQPGLSGYGSNAGEVAGGSQIPLPGGNADQNSYQSSQGYRDARDAYAASNGGPAGQGQGGGLPAGGGYQSQLGGYQPAAPSQPLGQPNIPTQPPATYQDITSNSDNHVNHRVKSGGGPSVVAGQADPHNNNQIGTGDQTLDLTNGQSPTFLDSGGSGGGDITATTQNDRNLAITQGQALGSQFKTDAGYARDQSQRYQGAADAAWDPSIAGNQFGYNEQQTADINGDPYAATNDYDQQAKDAARTGSDTLQTDIQNYGNDARTAAGAIDTRMQGDVNNYANQAGGIVSGFSKQAGGFVDPTALNTSSDFNSNYGFSDRDQQDIVDKAGVQVGNQGRANADAIARTAAAQGNTSPLALAAAQDRAAQTGQVGAADAMTDARIAAKQAGLQTTLQKEQTRLGAAQNYANTGIGVANSAADKGLGAARDVNTAASTANQYAGNQYQTVLSNQNAAKTQADQYSATQYQDALKNTAAGKTAAEAAKSGRALTTAEKQKTDQTAYRGYLTGQQQQQDTNKNVAGQQQLGSYSAQTGATNAAESNSIQNYSIPGAGTNLANTLIKTTGAALGAKLSK